MMMTSIASTFSCCSGIVSLNLMFFFFNDTATTEIYTLSLHDALPICFRKYFRERVRSLGSGNSGRQGHQDRKSTRLNSSHLVISYAVFCLKKNNNILKSSHSVRNRFLVISKKTYLLATMMITMRSSRF